MQNAARLTILSTALTLLACTEQSPPVFDDPVPMSVPSGKPAFGPRLSDNGSESVILSWMEPNDETSELRFSRFSIDDWEPATLAASDPDMFINWADLPSVTAHGDTLLAQWLSYVAEATYAYQVLIAFSNNGGASWGSAQSPHTDGTPTEHGFVSSYLSSAGIGLVWLDGRETPDAGMTLRTASVAEGEAPADEALLDDLVCDCCQTDSAETSDGPIVVYRDRTTDEVRDIYVSRQINGQWQPGVAVSNDGWVISGCPVNGPVVSADGGQVIVAWFTAANDQPIVKAAVSTNAGKTFSAPVAIATKNVLGHVAVSLVKRNSAAVSWLEADDDGSYEINLRSMTFDGQLGKVSTIGRTAISRNVPQLHRVNDELIFAWTDEINDMSKLATVRVRILGFYDD